MKLEHQLDNSDRQRVADTLARVANRTNRSMTLTDLLDEWRRFVIAVGQGYNWSLDIYYRDLGVRDVLEEVSESLSMNGRRVISDAVKPIDEEFIRLTWDPTKPEYTGRHGLEIGWWQFRVPLNPGDKLRSDLEKMDYLYPDINKGSNTEGKNNIAGILNPGDPELMRGMELA